MSSKRSDLAPASLGGKVLDEALCAAPCALDPDVDCEDNASAAAAAELDALGHSPHRCTAGVRHFLGADQGVMRHWRALGHLRLAAPPSFSGCCVVWWGEEGGDEEESGGADACGLEQCSPPEAGSDRCHVTVSSTDAPPTPPPPLPPPLRPPPAPPTLEEGACHARPSR